MAEQTFEQLVGKAVDAYNNQREALVKQREGIDKAIAALDEKWNATLGQYGAKSPTKSSGGGKRTSRRGEIVAVIGKNPKGIGRADIIEALGSKGDKSAEGSISNALAKLKKDKDVGYNDTEKLYLPKSA